MVMKQSEQDQRNVQSAQNGGTGESSDKEFLRTEPLGRLLLKLALPTVAAQLINMLYNIVDRKHCRQNLYRTYSGDRRNGPDRCGRLYAADHDRLGFCSAGGLWRSSPCLYIHGKER